MFANQRRLQSLQDINFPKNSTCFLPRGFKNNFYIHDTICVLRLYFNNTSFWLYYHFLNHDIAIKWLKFIE